MFYFCLFIFIYLFIYFISISGIRDSLDKISDPKSSGLKAKEELFPHGKNS